jgi:hypothetical protein
LFFKLTVSKKQFEINARFDFELYFDGILQDNVPNHANIEKTDSLNMSVLTKVVAVHGNGTGTGMRAILASTKDGLVMTTVSWICLNTAVSGWNEVEFTGTGTGENAAACTECGESYRGGISQNATWIWTKSPNEKDAYCRFPVREYAVYTCVDSTAICQLGRPAKARIVKLVEIY